MTAKRPVSFLEFLYREAGYRKGTRVAAFVVAWGIYSESLADGVEPNMDGYGKYWKVSRATAYRELQTFHAVFPDDVLPDRVWRKLSAAVESRKSLSVAMAQASGVRSVWS
jgi:hypothetical protein